MSTVNTKTENHTNQMDPKTAKQKATEEKYRLFGTLQAIRQGKMPHNDHLNDLLSKLAQNQIVLSREHLISEDGKLLLNDFRELLKTLETALNVKNKDELFQSMVYHLHCMDSPISKDNLNSAAKNNHDVNTMKSESKKASESIWRIGKLILINNEFRSVLGDSIDIFQDIFTSVTTKLGDSLKNTGDSLQENSQTQKPGKELVDSALDRGIDHHRKSSGLISTDPSDPHHAGLLNTGDSVHPSAISTEPSVKQDPQVANNTAQNETKFKDLAKNHYNDHKQHARQTIQSRVPKEKQDELLHRLQSVLSEIQRHPDYQDAIETLINLVKTWSSRLGKMSDDVQVQKDQESRHLAEKEFKTLVETWAQGKSIDPLLHGLQDVIKDAHQDPELREYYHSVMDYIKRLVREPGYAESTTEGERLMDRGRQVIKGNYKDHLNFLSNESRSYLNLIAKDPVARELSDRLAKIHRDLWMDGEGNPAFKPHLLNDIKMTLLPAFMDEIRYIPLPRIEYSDKQYDIVVENLVISGDTLLPNVFDTKIESFNSFSLKSDQSKPSSQSLLLRMSEIQADIDDVVFFYNKKSGFPKLQDSGVASMTVGGKGITLVLRIHNAMDPNKTFKVDYCKCSVDKLKVKVNDSRHNMLYKTIAPLMMGTIRKQMAKTIESMVIERLELFDQKITRSIVNTNQRLQDKHFESLSDAEKQGKQPRKVSPEQSRPGLWSTLVSIMNNNIKTRVNHRNEKKRDKKLRDDQASDVNSSKRSSVQFRSSGSSYSSAQDSGDILGEHNGSYNSPVQQSGQHGSLGRHSSSQRDHRNPLEQEQDFNNPLGHEDEQNRSSFNNPLRDERTFADSHNPLHGERTFADNHNPLHGERTRTDNHNPLHGERTRTDNHNPLHGERTRTDNHNPLHGERTRTDNHNPLHGERTADIQQGKQDFLQHGNQNRTLNPSTQENPLQGKHIDSPPPSPKKLSHDHSNNYKLANDLSNATNAH
ncbi:DNA ligase (ATP) [Rhizopus stolonifer]|uniref:DNA ligase (ATP) n=1 Tax=Rhizopus stolonifer TaxID=4846 RepID=A0A367KN67_RHIST|nr:DNA ligase (ATP) [Rhizopus stolonifer]